MAKIRKSGNEKFDSEHTWPFLNRSVTTIVTFAAPFFDILAP
jgi:hypothetical protein